MLQEAESRKRDLRSSELAETRKASWGIIWHLLDFLSQPPLLQLIRDESHHWPRDDQRQRGFGMCFLGTTAVDIYWNVKMAWVVACLELRRPPVSCGRGCFENNSLIWKCFVNFDKCEFVNDKISVLQEWWLSGSQKWRLRDLNVLIIWPVPAGMNYRHKSRRAVPPGSASVQRQPYGIILPLISSETCHTSCVWLATRWICKGGNTWERPFIITFKRER